MKENLVLRLHKERLGDRGGHRKVFLENRWSNSNKFYSYDLVSHYGCVNAVEFSHDGGWLVSGGDDRRVLLWNLEEALEGRGHVRCMAAEHKSNIFCLDTDHALTKIYSGGNDEQVIVHDTQTSELVDCFQHEEPVNGLSVHPVQSDLFLTACSDGRLLMYDMRQPATSEAIMIAGCSYAYHSVQFNPVEHRLLVGANQKFGIGLYDIRKPRSTVLSYHSRSSMHARFNSSGTQIVGLRKRLPPVIFNIHDPIPACEFDTPQYYNSCTMKSCCFGGPGDQYVFSGSDDFNLYAWKIPDDMKTTWVNRAHAVFKGHRSIVNQVRYNPHTQLLASSGVEKIIKLWSDWPFTQAESADSGSKARKVYTHEDYIGLVLRSDNILHLDTQFRSTQENPRMMAFFDSLVQREIEGWETEDDVENVSSDNEEATAEASEGGDSEDGAGGVAGFSHRSIGRRSRVLMERISVSIADDVMREERAIAEAQNTMGNNMLNTSNDSSESSSTSIPENATADSLDLRRESSQGSHANRRESSPLPGPHANNRIAELISQKRGHLIKVALRRGKRLRDMPETVINKRIHHARKVLRISEPEIRFSSPSGSSPPPSGEQSSSPPPFGEPSSSPRPGSSSSSGSEYGGQGTGKPSLLKSLFTSSSSDSENEYPSQGQRIMASSPLSETSPSPTLLSSPTSLGQAPATSSSGTPSHSQPRDALTDEIRDALTDGHRDAPTDVPSEENRYVEEDRDIDVASLLPSSSVTSNSRIKELRKRRLKIEKEEESDGD